jgi:hypothetical protein
MHLARGEDGAAGAAGALVEATGGGPLIRFPAKAGPISPLFCG